MRNYGAKLLNVDGFELRSTTALCTGLLRRLGVTHVLNAAMGKERQYCLINTSQSFYKSSGIQFHGVEALDLSSFKLDRFFEESAEFIDRALASGGERDHSLQ